MKRVRRPKNPKREAYDPRCRWCGSPCVGAGTADDRTYWVGWDPEIADFWPSAGVVICGPQCSKRPPHPNDPEGKAPVILRRPEFWNLDGRSKGARH